MPASVRAVIAEDEELARTALRRLVAETGWVELAGEATDGRTAIELIDRLRPDLLFLDVMLPVASGLEVLQRITHQPLVVFTTAYERFAVSAFEVEAIDYLVKPFGRRRFNETMTRVRRRLEERGSSERLYARIGSRVVPVPIRDITRFQAEGDYVRAFAGDGSHLLYVTLSELESKLPRPFLRIHRSHMINVDCVGRIERHDERRYVVVLKDGSRIIASRAGSAALRKVMAR